MARDNKNSMNTLVDHVQDMVDMFKQKNLERTVKGLHPIFDPNYNTLDSKILLFYTV